MKLYNERPPCTVHADEGKRLCDLYSPMFRTFRVACVSCDATLEDCKKAYVEFNKEDTPKIQERWRKIHDQLVKDTE